MPVLKLARDIPIPARQNFSVRLDFFPYEPLVKPLFGWFTAQLRFLRLGDALKTRQQATVPFDLFIEIEAPLEDEIRKLPGFFGALGRHYLRSPKW